MSDRISDSTKKVVPFSQWLGADSSRNDLMIVHFFDESPSSPYEQLARLGPPTTLLKASIPCVVWAEDALSIVHRVPTCLFDQHLLVPDDSLDTATHAICSSLPYTRSMVDDKQHWKDYRLFNADCPHAFNLNAETILLKPQNPTWAWKNVCLPF